MIKSLRLGQNRNFTEIHPIRTAASQKKNKERVKYLIRQNEREYEIIDFPSMEVLQEQRKDSIYCYSTGFMKINRDTGCVYAPTSETTTEIEGEILLAESFACEESADDGSFMFLLMKDNRLILNNKRESLLPQNLKYKRIIGTERDDLILILTNSNETVKVTVDLKQESFTWSILKVACDFYFKEKYYSFKSGKLNVYDLNSQLQSSFPLDCPSDSLLKQMEVLSQDELVVMIFSDFVLLVDLHKEKHSKLQLKGVQSVFHSEKVNGQGKLYLFSLSEVHVIDLLFIYKSESNANKADQRMSIAYKKASTKSSCYLFNSILRNILQENYSKEFPPKNQHDLDSLVNSLYDCDRLAKEDLHNVLYYVQLFFESEDAVKAPLSLGGRLMYAYFLLDSYPTESSADKLKEAYQILSCIGLDLIDNCDYIYGIMFKEGQFTEGLTEVECKVEINGPVLTRPGRTAESVQYNAALFINDYRNRRLRNQRNRVEAVSINFMPLKRREVFDETESEGESEAEQVTEVSKEIENLEPIEEQVIEEEHEEEISSTDNETEHNTVPNTPVAASKPASSWLSTLTGLFSPFVQGYGKRERSLSAEHTDDEGEKKSVSFGNVEVIEDKPTNTKIRAQTKKIKSTPQFSTPQPQRQEQE